MLIGVVGRLTAQKGVDALLDALPKLMTRPAQIALLGAGDAELEAGFAAAAKQFSGRVAAFVGYRDDLAHMIFAGADALLAPSRYEPCGVAQLLALRYGAVPVVSRVGGLKDSVIDANEMALRAGVATGFLFSPHTSDALLDALRRAEHVFRDPPRWRQLQINGMKTDVSWRPAAKRYAEIYRDLVEARAR
ncbi:MAG: glycosyltransferase [Methylocystis sp.]|nr:glycosyltransferase [Methylocystis sp.]